MNVRLRALDEGDATWLDRWLAVVAGVVGHELGTAPSPGSALLRRLREHRRVAARVIERDARAVGIVVFSTPARARTSALVELVALAPGETRAGSGMRAVALLEEQMRADGIRTVYAPASAAHGISMYFWIRLGYHPLMRSEWPCERPGIAWLARDVAGN